MSHSRIQIVSVVFASLVLWIGLFLLFLQGFLFIHESLTHTGLKTQLVHAVFNLFFLALTVMLFFSSAIITYGSLYRGDEVAFLLTRPLRTERIVIHKFQETVFFSCWGFLLLGSPMLLAYGIVADSPWYYYALLGPFVLSFVFVPAGLGAIACLLVVRILSRVRVYALVAVGALMASAAGVFGWRILAYQNRNMMTLTWFQDVLARLQFSEQRLLPSWWLSSGLLEAAHPVFGPSSPSSFMESMLFLSVLVSNALLLQVVLLRLSARMFRPSYSDLAGLGRSRRRRRRSLFDRTALALLRPFPSTMRHLILKDLRLFFRDPVQWSQFAIFFGLLALYFFNVRRFDYSGVMEKWVLIISFMNLAVVGLILSTFTTRFIFPMVSLEGRCFWILGTAPLDRDSILWGKFWFAFAGAGPPCAILVLISDLMLRIGERSLTIVLVHQFACIVLCVGLSALAVGLGARLPNLREPSPSKIAAGYGGTLNLVLSSFYIIGVVLATAIPCVFWSELNAMNTAGEGQYWWYGGRFGLGSTGCVGLGVTITLALSALATCWPLRSGFRAFRRLEF
jgi:ABC-2 type transport system permease protein